jgi:hypothetical protein
MTRPDDQAILEADVDVVEPIAARCPFGHGGEPTATTEVQADVCPIPHRRRQPVRRSRADEVVRRLLRIRDRPPNVSEASAYSTFQRSMFISAIRCTLTYVVFPFVLPAAGFATGVGPVLGIIIGVVAITCDVYTIRRFFMVDHRWRWHFSAIAGAVICLLLVLLVQDIVHLVS